jgi:hypothetical protein
MGDKYWRRRENVVDAMKRESYVGTQSIGEGLGRKTSAKQERKNGIEAGSVDAREKLLACRSNKWREPLRTARGKETTRIPKINLLNTCVNVRCLRRVGGEEKREGKGKRPVKWNSASFNCKFLAFLGPLLLLLLLPLLTTTSKGI